ncbi:MAG: hypothetical protein JNL40_02225 [Cyclobacteriaceae bacterium]|nr:hypothetical protein [Cyclobacteriaceae bacterium]
MLENKWNESVFTLSLASGASASGGGEFYFFPSLCCWLREPQPAGGGEFYLFAFGSMLASGASASW